MTITDDEIQELRRLYTVARDTVSTTAYQRDVALRKTSDLMVWNGFDGGDGILPGILDEVLRLRSENKAVLCRGCGGTIGDHLAPDQGGCPGDFRIDGVSVAPVAARDAEIARLRAENSSQNKALTMLATGIGNPPLAMFDEPIEDALVKTALGEIARLRTELRRFEKQEPKP